MIRNTAIFGLLENSSPQESLAAIARLDDRDSQLNMYLYWFPRHLRGNNAAARRDALKRAGALIDAKPKKEEFRLCTLAGELSEIGEHAARKVLDQCKSLLAAMPNGQRGQMNSRLNLALAMAAENTAEAKKIAGELEPGPMLMLAGAIARERPQEVEKFLADVPNELSLMQLSGVANNLPEVVLRVARHDAAAAERILLRFARAPQCRAMPSRSSGWGGAWVSPSPRRCSTSRCRR